MMHGLNLVVLNSTSAPLLQPGTLDVAHTEPGCTFEDELAIRSLRRQFDTRDAFSVPLVEP